MSEEQNFAEQFKALSDERLLEVIESKSLYTEAALEAANAEVDKRGGVNTLKQSVEQKSFHDEIKQKSTVLSSVLRFLSKTISSLNPDKEKFDKYPSLYWVTKIIRLIVVILAAIGIIMILSIVFNTLRFSPHHIMMSTLILFYLVLASTILLAVSEGLLVLMDIEKNTRREK